MTLELKPHSGEDIREVIRVMKHVSHILQLTVCCKFNDVFIYAKPDESYTNTLVRALDRLPNLR
jgi:hypothetical protein